jgi:hypothetical protein
MRVSAVCSASIGEYSNTSCSLPNRPETRTITCSMQAHPVEPNKHAGFRTVGEQTEIVCYSSAYALSPTRVLDFLPSLCARKTSGPRTARSLG